jgi:hypothetical protein
VNGWDEDCVMCEGAGEIENKVPVSWSTIKKIYRKIVDNLGEQNEI